MLGLSEKQLEVWREYIEVIGEDHFYYNPGENNDLPMIYSRFFCGFDTSESNPAETKRLIATAISRAKVNDALLQKQSLSSTEVHKLISTVVPQYYDEEILMMLEDCQNTMTIQEHWELLIEYWTQQEFTTDGTRRRNWKKIFKHLPTIPELTNELPDEFIAYRAGDLNGFSWTLNKNIAEKFQERFALNFGNIPLHSKKFNKTDVLFYTNKRREQEVVIIS